MYLEIQGNDDDIWDSLQNNTSENGPGGNLDETGLTMKWQLLNLVSTWRFMTPLCICVWLEFSM